MSKPILVYNYILQSININNNIKDWNKLKDYELTEIFDCNNEEIVILINMFNGLIINNKNYYKFENYNYLFLLIINCILYLKNNRNYIYNFHTELLINISLLNKGQIYLEKIKSIINQQKDNINCLEILFEVCKKGTLPIYFFWKKIINSQNIILLNISKLVMLSCINNDMRILKYLINNEYDSNNALDIEKVNSDFFDYIFDNRNTIKKQFKILKMINEKYPLGKYLNLMLEYTNYSLPIIEKICKYYHNESNEINYNQILQIFNSHIILPKFSFVEQEQEIDYNNLNILKINSILITQQEKILLLIIKNIFMNYITDEELVLINTKTFENIIINNKDSIIISIINYLPNINDRINNQLICFIINKFIEKKYFNEFLMNIENSTSYYNKIGIYSRFFSSKIVNMIKINYVLHKLRCKARKIFKNRVNEINFKISPIIFEIKNFIPNKTKTILNKGSHLFQLSKQKFTTLPPRHLIPHELLYINNCLIKEKSDGINVTKLPINTYPITLNYMIKAEYIEEYDLYLVYDINIENMDIIERQNYLRTIHPFTKNLKNYEIINNIDELIKQIKLERINLEKFINQSNEQIKWYPKTSFKIKKLSNQFISEIYNFIEETNKNINDTINFGIIKNDGLILTPLDGSQELKIKPKSLMTIDLIFNNNIWLDSNNNSYDNILNKQKYREGKIYRCYPIIKNNKVFFDPREIRFDKKRPNNNNICNIVKSIFDHNWLLSIKENNIYYQKNDKVRDIKIVRILEQNKNIFLNYIKNINIDINKNWLDLGCGRCKLFDFIKDYNPKIYNGIDIDIKSLIKAYKKFNSEENFKIFNYDLNNNWNNQKLKLYDFDSNLKYDYIICNFSLMHFCNDIFWNQLNKVSKLNTKFIFNITKSNSLWEMNHSYLKSNNEKTELYFEWLHNNPVIENIINKKDIEKYCIDYDWKIIDYQNLTNNSLIKCYDWYILEKK
jgi:hypothetical protein